MANRPDPTPLLEVRQLAVAYGDVQVLWDASLTIDEGSVTALLGPNGAGKSTMLKTIMGLKRPLRFDTARLSGYRLAERVSASNFLSEGGE